MKQDLDARLLGAFDAAFKGAPEVVVRAPGRVNLIGEHTDYNDGFVMPAALSVETRVAARARADGLIRVAAADYGGAFDEIDLTNPITRSTRNPWANYVRGVVDEMRRSGFEIAGADFAIAGNIPQGAGLSSSASLEVATAFAIATLAGIEPDRTEIAQIAQRAENDFVGCKCGVMDQLVSARGEEGAALLIDCRSLDWAPIRAPKGAAILIVHSGVTRGLVDGAYNERRAQCEAAAKALGVPALRDADLPMLEAHRDRLDPMAFLRARHVVSENARTIAASLAYGDGALATLGELMAASHRSMRDDFEITTPDVDRLVALLQEIIGAGGGARMTGGGFGGCVVGVLPARDAADVAAEIRRRYQRPDGKEALVLIESPQAGASVV